MCIRMRLMIPLNISSNEYGLGGKTIKAISASASKDKTGTVHISLVNIDANKEQELRIDLGGISPGTVTGRILQSGKLQDYNSFENPQKITPVTFNGTSLKGNTTFVKITSVFCSCFRIEIRWLLHKPDSIFIYL